MHRLTGEHFLAQFRIVPLALLVFKQESEALCHSQLRYQDLPALFANLRRRQVNGCCHDSKHLPGDELQQTNGLNFEVLDPAKPFYQHIVTTHEIIGLGLFGTGNMEGVHTSDAPLFQFQGSLGGKGVTPIYLNSWDLGDRESSDLRNFIEMMIIAGQIETGQALHGSKMKGIAGLQQVIEHILEHPVQVLRSDLRDYEIGKCSKSLQSGNESRGHFRENFAFPGSQVVQG